jgi:hypothetical protein
MISERPLSDKELKALNKIIRQLDKNKNFEIKFLIGWTIVAIILGVLIYNSDNKTSIDVLILIGVIYVGIGV